VIHKAKLEHNKNISKDIPSNLSQKTHPTILRPKSQTAQILCNSRTTCPLAVGFHSGHVAKGKVADGLWPH
jgi:hypothetical protein